MRYSWETAKDFRSAEPASVVPDPAVFACLFERGDAMSLERSGHFARALARLDGDPMQRARLLLRTGDAAQGEALIEQCLEDAQSSGERVAESLALSARVACELDREDDLLALLDDLDTAFALGRETNSTDAKAHALSAVGAVYTRMGDRRVAREIFNRASLLHQRSGDLRSLGKVYNAIGVTYFADGDFVSAIPYLERGLDFLCAEPDLLDILHSLNNNVCAFELQYFESAHHMRQRVLSLLGHVPDGLGRLSDKTVLRVNPGAAPGADHAEFVREPFIGAAVLLWTWPRLST